MQYIGIYDGNPTADNTDGAPVSENGVMSNPVDALIQVGGNDVVVTCAVRTEPNYTVDGDVTITVVTKLNGGETVGNDYVKVADSQGGTYGNSITLSGVGATNKLFYVKMKAGAVAGSYKAAALRLQATVTGV